MSQSTSARTASGALRLVYPQWQGAGRDNVAQLLPEFPADEARRGYALGSRVLDAILPAHDGPTEVVEVGDADNEGSTAGIESRAGIVASLAAAQRAIDAYDPERILTLGGECSVSVAPFASLAAKYGDDLAIIWIDSHPDADSPDTAYDGFHAMAATVLVGYGDQEIVGSLPATVDPKRFAYAGLHDGEDDAFANVDKLGLQSFGPDALRADSAPLLEWLARTGASKVAIHLDVDTVDSEEAALGLGKVPGGLSSEQVRRLVADIENSADVVGLTIAEFIPRDVIALHGLVRGMPLLGE